MERAALGGLARVGEHVRGFDFEVFAVGREACGTLDGTVNHAGNEIDVFGIRFGECAELFARGGEGRDGYTLVAGKSLAFEESDEFGGFGFGSEPAERIRGTVDESVTAYRYGMEGDVFAGLVVVAGLGSGFESKRHMMESES